ncbi:MAG: ABC transporter permease [Oscillospiraceae bacterium]|nr:ABC transporter permease [Oscillospiraceae bacterium]
MNLILETLFSENTITATIRVLTLLVYGTMAAVINVTVGIPNIGIEGIFLSSALVAVIGSWLTQSWVLGMLCAVAWGIGISVLFGYLVMKLQTNNILCGLAINMFASGGTVFALSAITGQKGSSISLASKVAPKFDIPLLSEIPFIKVLFTNYSLFTYLAVFVVVFVVIMIKKTPIGLKIRAVGLNPNAASSVGISVGRIRYTAFIMSGAIAGLGGAYITMGYFSSFSRDMTAGIGFMCIAACNMGGATPLGGVLAALLFAFANVLSNVMQSLQMSVDLINGFPYMITVLTLLIIGIINTVRSKKAASKN